MMPIRVIRYLDIASLQQKQDIHYLHFEGKIKGSENESKKSIIMNSCLYPQKIHIIVKFVGV